MGKVHPAGISCVKVVAISEFFAIRVTKKIIQLLFSRYLESNRSNQLISNLACPTPFLSNQKLHSITAIKSSSESNNDMFAVMKENAMFLLELSSTSSRMSYECSVFEKFVSNQFISFAAILGNQKKHSFQMPVVNEHQPTDRAGSSRIEFSRHGKTTRSYRKSEVPSPELIWQVSDMFLCLESLGASVAKDSAPYDRMSYAESSFDRVSSINIRES